MGCTLALAAVGIIVGLHGHPIIALLMVTVAVMWAGALGKR